MSDNVIKNKIIGLVDIDWENNLFDLQPDNIKIKQNHKHLKESILKHGFAQPFFTFIEDGKSFCLDGHTRKQVLKELQLDGYKVPKKLKAVQIKATDRKEAIQILLEVFNQKHNPFSDEVLIEWLEVEEIDKSEINFQSMPIEIMNMNEFEEFGDNSQSLPKDLSDQIQISFKLEIECVSEIEQEKLYNELINKGYQCRVLTL